MSEKNKLVIIIGSVRQGRFGPAVAEWVRQQALAHNGFDIDTVDLADYDLPLELPATPPKFAGDSYERPASLTPLTARLDRADAFLVVTPEYNHSYPASLKAAIDWHYTQWTAKPVAIVSYGGSTGGRHAALHLENVFAELNAVPIRDRLAFENAFHWEDGRPADDQAANHAKLMFDVLSWWSTALRKARSAQPYPA